MPWWRRRAPLHVGALRGSDSNRFYLRHGFVLEKKMGEWDNTYVRPAQQQTGDRPED